MQPGSNIQPKLIDVTSGVLLPQNDNRTAIIIPSHPTTRYTLSFGVTAVLDNAVNIPPAFPPIVMEGDTWKCVLKREIHAITTGAPITIQVIEVIDTDRQIENEESLPDDIEMGRPQMSRGLEQRDSPDSLRGGVTWLD